MRFSLWERGCETEISVRMIFMTRAISMHVHWGVIGASGICIWIPVQVMGETIFNISISIPGWNNVIRVVTTLSQVIVLKATTNRARESIWEYGVLSLVIRVAWAKSLRSRCWTTWISRNWDAWMHCSWIVLVLLEVQPGRRWGLFCAILKLVLYVSSYVSSCHSWSIFLLSQNPIV